ncbi:MAG: hypothetical protein KAI17_21590, partial [Thiotrichaceae bacterium]|nr:hypothetical protein [Thiotrichaceae bacterium]
FSSFSADRTTIRLEKLELDLGSFSMDNLDTQFTEKLKKQLIKELKKELLHSPDAALQKNRKSTIQSQEESDIELVLYYLQQGVLPWWLADAEAFQLQTLLDKLFNYSADEFIHELERLNCIQAIERLVKQLTGDHYELLLNRISLTADGNTAGSIVQAIQDWNRLIDAADLELRQVIQIKARLIYFLLQSFPVEQSANILSEYIGRTALISSGSDTERNIVTSLALNAQTLLSDNSEVYLWIDQKMLQLFPSTEMRFSTISSSAISGSAVSDNNAINSAADKRTAVAADKKQLPFAKGVPGQLLQTDAAADNWPNTGDHYYINNAGVILLWPFLSPYFSTLNLLKDKKFVSEQSL